MLLFEPLTVGRLALRNRLMRSATAERMADPDTGAPSPRMAFLYQRLAEGGVGLIVTGHAYVDRAGKAHPEMASIADDLLIAPWRETISRAQFAGARVVLQMNHGGANCDPAITANPLSPAGQATTRQNHPHMATEEEIQGVLAAFGRAAWRAREAGFDGVQLHGAHGYLISQFLMPGTNLRHDRWGGDAERRRAFLEAVIAEIRRQVGADYPVWIKLGVASDATGGLAPDEGAQAATTCAARGIDAVEVSHALGIPDGIDPKAEAAYLPWAQVVRQAVGPGYPLALVSGFRSLDAMERILASGIVQMISLCRPLVAEPDLPARLRAGHTVTAACIRCSRCWPEKPGEGVDCHNPQVRRQVVLERGSQSLSDEEKDS